MHSKTRRFEFCYILPVLLKIFQSYSKSSKNNGDPGINSEVIFTPDIPINIHALNG